jgi:hypothetical protein
MRPRWHKKPSTRHGRTGETGRNRRRLRWLISLDSPRNTT